VQERVKVFNMETEADCGMKCSESFARYDRDTSSWRTSQLLLTGEWEPFSEGWPKAGIMLDGRCYRQPRLERTIIAKDGGALPRVPRPTAMDGCGASRSMKRQGWEAGPRNNLRDYFGFKHNYLYPPAAMVDYLMGYPTEHTAFDASETP